jgi:hypothetical protein
MVGRFADPLHFQAGENNLLIVRGPLIAEAPGDLGKVVRIEATLTQGSREDNCNSNGDRFSPAWDPGSTWTMNLHTDKITSGTVTGTAAAYDADGKRVARWNQSFTIS